MRSQQLLLVGFAAVLAACSSVSFVPSTQEKFAPKNPQYVQYQKDGYVPARARHIGTLRAPNPSEATRSALAELAAAHGCDLVTDFEKNSDGEMIAECYTLKPAPPEPGTSPQAAATPAAEAPAPAANPAP